MKASAEAELTIPDALAAFFGDTYDLIRNDDYAQVSDARSGCREFGASSCIDQVDLVHLAKTMDPVADGDIIDFLCDYYSYDGDYLDSYMLGGQLIVDGALEISDVYVDADAALLTYLFTDIYNQQYWSAPAP